MPVREGNRYSDYAIAADIEMERRASRHDGDADRPDGRRQGVGDDHAPLTHAASLPEVGRQDFDFGAVLQYEKHASRLRRFRFPDHRSTVGPMDAVTAATLSRVELEPVLARDLRIGDLVSAEVIRAELASRVWQGFNPYAAAV